MLPNPFATRFTAPGRVPYLADTGHSARLHDAWVKHGRVGAILGPHGVGKSTLLATLEQAWSCEHGYRVRHVALHDGQRSLPPEFWRPESCQQDLVIIDGYEQLGWRARWALQRLRRRTACGLLVTAHEALRLPTLIRVEPDYEMFLAVVRRLLGPWSKAQQADEFLARHAAAAWQQSGGNTREALFGLYDCWEECSQGRKTLAELPKVQIQSLTTLATFRNSSGCNGPRDAIEIAAREVSSN